MEQNLRFQTATFATLSDRRWQALKYLKAALEIHKKIGHLQGEANHLSNIGLVYSDLGEKEEALQYLKQAENIFRKISLNTQADSISSKIKEIESWKK